MHVYAMDRQTRFTKDEIHTNDHQESQNMLLGEAPQIVLDELEYQDRSEILDIESRSINILNQTELQRRKSLNRSGEQESNVMHKEDDTTNDINHIQFHR